MIAKNLRFIPRDTRDHSPAADAFREYKRMKGESLKHIVLDRFLNHYGYDKGAVTASAIIDDLLALIEQYYRYKDNSFLKQGQIVWHAVPVDEYPKKGKSMAQTRLKPVVLDMITDDDIEGLVIDALVQFYGKRQARIREALAGRPLTAYEVMREIFPRASPRELFLTASETVANLVVLEARGEALRDLEGGVYRFRLAA